MSFSRTSRGKSRSMSGSAVSSSLRKRPSRSLLAIGSTWLRPVRWQTIEETLEPRPRPGRQQRAGVARPAHLDRDLARELEQVAMQEKEAGEAEAVDDAQLLLQARLGLLVVRAAARVALVEARLADLGQRAARGAVLGAGIAVAEVAREVEGQRLRRAARSPRPHRDGRRSAPPSPAGVVSTCAWLPRRSGSEASSVVCSRIATKASCR